MGFSLDDLKDRLRGTVERLTGAGEIENQVAMTEQLEAVQGIVEEVHEALADGLQWKDLQVLGTVVGELVELVDDVEDMSNEDKSAFVQDAAYVVYKVYDPDIPGIPNWIENKIEYHVVRAAAKGMIGAALRILRKLQNKSQPAPEAPAADEAGPTGEAGDASE